MNKFKKAVSIREEYLVEETEIALGHVPSYSEEQESEVIDESKSNKPRLHEK